MTAAVVAAFAGLGSACGPLVNDWSNHRVAPPASYETRLAVGASARDLLSGANFKKAAIEIQAVRGYAPAPETVDRLKRFLEERLEKPGGISVTVASDFASPASSPSTGAASPPAGMAKYTLADARSFELRFRRSYPRKDELAAYVVFVDGVAADDHDGVITLGEAYGNTSIVIYEGSLRAETAKSSKLQLWQAETKVLEHEFGHLLGLVHKPTTTSKPAHEDSAHPGHCANPACLMNSAGDTAAVIALLANGQSLDLDDDCLRDLKDAGGK